MPGKILVVDDEVHIKMLLEQTLEELEDEFGVEVLSASDGEEGLRLIQEHSPGLVILDIMMPRMNGYEVCRAVRANPDLAAVKIVLLTAKGQEVDRRQGLEMGATQYMTKPFDPDEVLTLARTLLELG